ncbi:MAG: hypothetical protein ACRC6H_02070, partial [Culicoidibacterales bacterium]
MYVQVIVDLPIQEKDQTYDYRYDGPENLIGYRVAIRVGPQRRQGIVIGMSETTPWDPKKVRAIEKVLDEQPVLNHEQIRLAFWLAQTTESYFYQALQTMLPNAKKLGKKQGVKELKMRVVTKVHELELAKGAKKQREAYEYLLSERLPVSVTELNQLFGNSAIQALIQKGALTIEEQTKWRNPYEHYEVLPFVKHPLNS